MGSKIFAVLMIVVVVGVVVFFVQSNTLGTLFSSFGDFSSKFTSPFSFPSIETRERSSRPIINENTGVSTREKVTIQSRAPEGFTEEDLSPYFEKFNISSVSAGSRNSYGRISLVANFRDEERVNVTGWRFQANRGSQIVPKAVNLYDPSGLAIEGDIYLGKRERVILYTSQSAIGINLRLNSCIGYLENTNKFTPSLPRRCPSPSRDVDTSSFTGECQNFVRSIGSCRLPKVNPDIPKEDYACRAYIETINYKGCYDRHRGDSDFLDDEWWVWTGNKFLDERHDKIFLFDREGKLVDVYSY